MQAITITEEQKEKLLEMCKVLFPKYDIEIHDKKVPAINLDDVFVDLILHKFKNEGTKDEEYVLKGKKNLVDFVDYKIADTVNVKIKANSANIDDLDVSFAEIKYIYDTMLSLQQKTQL